MKISFTEEGRDYKKGEPAVPLMPPSRDGRETRVEKISIRQTIAGALMGERQISLLFDRPLMVY
jgi:hypothetical protein